MPIAGVLVIQAGCVSPAAIGVDESEPAPESAPEPAETADEPSSAEQQVATLEAEVATLEATVAALETEAGDARMELGEAQAAAQDAAQMIAEAKAQIGAAQEAAAAARADAGTAVAAAHAERRFGQAGGCRPGRQGTIRLLAAARAAATDGARRAQAKMIAEAKEAQAKIDMMMAAQPAPALMVAADRLDLSRLDLDSARVSLAGPDSVYVSSIRYGGRNYSALLKYQGGTTAIVEQVFGPEGMLIPATVGLAQTELAFVPPDVLDIAYVEVGGKGYSGQLRHAGDNRLEVAGIQRVELPPTAAERLADAQAAAAAALAEARAAAAAEVAAAQAAAADAEAAAAAAMRQAEAAAAATAEVQAQIEDLRGRRVAVPAGLNIDLISLDAARLSVAGPDSIYLTGIGYGNGTFAARMRYLGGNQGILEALYDASAGRIPNVDLSTPALEVVAPDTLVVSNVGIGGAAYSFSLQFSLDGSIVGAAQEQGHRVRTAAELQRDDLLNAADADSLVSGFGAGAALPDEGAWSMTASGTVVQTDAGASHAKFAVADVAQPEVLTLYGLTARVDGGARVGYGLHFLASGTPDSGNTWNFGHSYLVWLTREPGFYDTEETQVQLYESLDDNRLVWRKSRNIERTLSSGLTLEALYDPNDCPETMGNAPCHGSIAVLVDGAEQFKVAVSGDIAGRAADTVALRTLGGPVEFTDLYVRSGR